jgi:hypothetical protein
LKTNRLRQSNTSKIQKKAKHKKLNSFHFVNFFYRGKSTKSIPKIYNEIKGEKFIFLTFF